MLARADHDPNQKSWPSWFDHPRPAKRLHKDLVFYANSKNSSQEIRISVGTGKSGRKGDFSLYLLNRLQGFCVSPTYGNHRATRQYSTKQSVISPSGVNHNLRRQQADEISGLGSSRPGRSCPGQVKQTPIYGSATTECVPNAHWLQLVGSVLTFFDYRTGNPDLSASGDRTVDRTEAQADVAVRRGVAVAVRQRRGKGVVAATAAPTYQVLSRCRTCRIGGRRTAVITTAIPFTIPFKHIPAMSCNP